MNTDNLNGCIIINYHMNEGDSFEVQGHILCNQLGSWKENRPLKKICHVVLKIRSFPLNYLTLGGELNTHKICKRLQG